MTSFPSTTAFSSPASPRIGTIPLQLHYAYWASVAQGITARAKELGVTLCMTAASIDEASDAMVYELLELRPQVVIVPWNAISTLASVETILTKAGIPIVAVEATPDPQYASVVRVDEGQGTIDVVTHLFEQLGGSGKVVHIRGSWESDRHVTFHALLSRYPNIELVYEDGGDWDRKDGANIMRAALAAHPDVRGVFADNDLMAVGATDVIAEHGLRDQIVVVGYDADPEGLQAIHAGSMAATIYRGQYGIGRTSVDIAVQVLRGEPVAPEVCLPTRLITRDNLVDATLDSLYVLPGVLRDLVESGRMQRQLQDATINTQRQMIRELSTPIIPISDSILVLPLIGTIDSERAHQLMEAMLYAIGQQRAQHLIVDITGIAVVDTQVAKHLIEAAQAAQLLGSRVMITGIRPEMAQTLVSLGVDLRNLSTHSTLQLGIAAAQRSERRPAR